jgi:hypothetical protein
MARKSAFSIGSVAVSAIRRASMARLRHSWVLSDLDSGVMALVAMLARCPGSVCRRERRRGSFWAPLGESSHAKVVQRLDRIANDALPRGAGRERCLEPRFLVGGRGVGARDQ